MIVNSIIDFMMMFLIIYLVYIFFINKRKANYELLKENDFIKIFVQRYNIDIEKIDYRFLINIIALINSFIIAFTSTIILNIKSIIWSIIVAFVVLFLLVYILFGLAGKYLKNIEKQTKVKMKKKKKIKKKEDVKNV